MIDFMHCLTNSLFFDIPSLYSYTSLNSSIIWCVFSGYISFFWCFFIISFNFECNFEHSFAEDFFETLVILSAILLPIKSPVASAVFWITLFEAVFIASVVYFFALSRGFWPNLLLKFLPMFFAKDKNPYTFTYILTLGSIEYLNFINDSVM